MGAKAGVGALGIVLLAILIFLAVSSWSRQPVVAKGSVQPIAFPHNVHVQTFKLDCRPAYSERRASLWQYWQSSLYVWAWALCGKAIGWTEPFATTGCRLHDETARKIRMARSTMPSAPTPAFAPIDSRSPPGGFGGACGAYHSRRDPVNRQAPPRASRARPPRRAPPPRWRHPRARTRRTR